MVILAADEGDIVLAEQHIGHLLDIVEIIADDAHAGDIAQLVVHIFNGHGDVARFQLFQNAGNAFEPCFNMMDGIVFIPRLKAVVEIFQLGTHLLDGGTIDLHLTDEGLHNIRRDGVFLLLEQFNGAGFVGHRGPLRLAQLLG